MKVVRATQPQGVVRIDMQNRLSHGLVFACVGGTPVDLVSGATPDTNASTIEATKLGRMQLTSTANPLVIPRTHRARPMINGEITMLVYGQNQSSVQWPRMAQIRDNSNTSLIFIEQELDNSYWGIHNVGGTNDFPGYAGGSGKAPTGVGVPYQFGMTMKNNQFFRSFFNGKLHYEDITGTYNFFSDASLTTNVTWANGTGTFGNYLTAIWGRTLDAGEFASLNANPWQLFEPEVFDRRKIFLPPEVTVTSKRWHRVPEKQRVQPVAEQAKIDWSNPITRNLVCAVLPSANIGAKRLLVLTDPLNTLGEGGFGYEAGTRIDSLEHGVAISFGGGSYIRRASFNALPVDPDLTSLIAFVPYVSFGAGTHTMHEVTGGSFQVPSIVKLEASNAVTFTQGAADTITHQNAARLLELNTAIYRNKHTATNPLQDAWLNGVRSTSTTNSTAQPGFNATVLSFGNNGGAPANAVGYLLQLLWNRILSDAEVMALSRNPWQLFRLDKLTLLDLQTLYPTLSLAQLINLAATQATPRVTVDVP